VIEHRRSRLTRPQRSDVGLGVRAPPPPPFPSGPALHAFCAPWPAPPRGPARPRDGKSFARAIGLPGSNEAKRKQWGRAKGQMETSARLGQYGRSRCGGVGSSSPTARTRNPGGCRGVARTLAHRGPAGSGADCLQYSLHDRGHTQRLATRPGPGCCVRHLAPAGAGTAPDRTPRSRAPPLRVWPGRAVARS